MRTTGISFEKMLHSYNNPPAGGKVLSIPDFIFNHNKWELYGLSKPLNKEPNSPNELILKHKGDKMLMLAIYIPVVTFLNKEGLWLERDDSKEDFLSLPFNEDTYNKRLFEEDVLIIGSQMVRGVAESPVTNIPCKTLSLGFNSYLVPAVIERAGGLPKLAREVKDRLSC